MGAIYLIGLAPELRDPEVKRLGTIRSHSLLFHPVLDLRLFQLTTQPGHILLCEFHNGFPCHLVAQLGIAPEDDSVKAL
jgi:hypothetical protein